MAWQSGHLQLEVAEGGLAVRPALPGQLLHPGQQLVLGEVAGGEGEDGEVGHEGEADLHLGSRVRRVYCWSWQNAIWLSFVTITIY